MRGKGDRRLDYFPVLSFFLFWLASAVAGALTIGDPALIKLGVVTTPAVAAMVITVLKIRRSHRQR